MTTQARQAHLQFLVTGAVFGVIMLLWSCSVSVVQEHHRQLAEQLPVERQSEQEFNSRAAALFEKLDSAHSKLLSKEDVRNCILEGKLTGVDLADAQKLYDNFDQIGHVIGQYRAGKGRANIYAVSPVDLTIRANALEDWLQRKYGKHYVPPKP